MTTITRRIAEEAAAILKLHPEVDAVELFGSVARDGVGDDLDLIVIANKKYYEKFVRQTNRISDQECFDEGTPYYGNFTGISSLSATNVMGEEFFSLTVDVFTLVNGKHLDLFIFYKDWQNDIKSLQKDLPHRDPDFIKNIALDAFPI